MCLSKYLMFSFFFVCVFYFSHLLQIGKGFLLRFTGPVRVYRGNNGRFWEVRVLSVPQNTGTCGGCFIDDAWTSFVSSNNIVEGERLDVYHDNDSNFYIRVFNVDGNEGFLLKQKMVLMYKFIC